MKPCRDNLIAWTFRIVGWSATLALSVYIAVNYDGISVRGQIARLSTPFENREAMQSLLNMFGDAPAIPRLVNLRPAYPFFDPGPWYTLCPSPIALVLEENTPHQETQRKFVLVFDRDGHRVGDPIILSASTGISYHLSSVEVVAHGKSHFLLVDEYSFLRTSSTPISGPPSLSMAFRVRQMNDYCAPEVFALTVQPPKNEWSTMSIESDDGNLRLQLVRRFRTRSGWSSETVAEFEWDAATEQFVGPPSDPEGWWQVLQSAPESHTP